VPDKPSLFRRLPRLADLCRSVGEVAIALFCIWHMFAITVATVPYDAEGGFRKWIHAHLTPISRTYLLITSQWQTWNLFSPQSYNGNDGFAVQALSDQGWKVVYQIDKQLSSWRLADELRVLRYMSGKDDRAHKLQERYLASYCVGLGLPVGTPVRLLFHWTRPRLEAANPKYPVPETAWPGFTTVCPANDPAHPIAPVTLL
jgi:hypothetical protein